MIAFVMSLRTSDTGGRTSTSAPQSLHNADITAELNSIIKLFDQHNTNRLNGRINLDNKIGNFIQDSKIRQLKKIIEDFKLEVKVAIPNSEYVDGVFEERMGIFRDTNDDVVAFSGTSNVTFDAENRNFESVDVFTSWDDKTRVDNKIKNFEDLWANRTNYVEIYDLVYAEKKNLLKYTTEWAVYR